MSDISITAIRPGVHDWKVLDIGYFKVQCSKCKKVNFDHEYDEYRGCQG